MGRSATAANYPAWALAWEQATPEERERRRRQAARVGCRLDPQTGEQYAPAYCDAQGQVRVAPDHYRLRARYGGDQEAAALSKATNGHGADIEIERRQISEDIGGPVFQSVEFKAMKEGASEVKDFHFDKPVRVVLRYNAVNGVPVPSASPLSSSSARPASGSAKNLGVYWHNGVEFKKLYGKVDPAAQTLTVDTPNIGLFQVRSLYRADGAVFDLSNLSSRVITPNDDGLNDVVIFTYDPGPNNAQPAGRIYDLQGRFVADMTSGLVPNTLTWDGKMNGRAAASGVYVYEIKGDGKTFNGTIVVAR